MLSGFLFFRRLEAVARFREVAARLESFFKQSKQSCRLFPLTLASQLVSNRKLYKLENLFLETRS